MLANYTIGERSERPTLLIVHGLFGSARNWGVIAKRLSDTRQVLTVDMRNHGHSFRGAPHDYPAMAGDLAEVIESIGEKVDVIGHSMGGKASMVLALVRPELVRRMVVADIAPVAYGHTQQGMIDAMGSVDLSKVETRADADAMLAKSVENQGVRAFLLQSLDVREKAWRLNLNQLSADMDAILGFPEISGTFKEPVLMLSGAESDYVTREQRPEIKRLFPAARFAKIPGAGHWLHADRPREFEAACRAFLDA
jgi:pimeloyl-ACP methyl ester carboxylesterase